VRPGESKPTCVVRRAACGRRHPLACRVTVDRTCRLRAPKQHIDYDGARQRDYLAFSAWTSTSWGSDASIAVTSPAQSTSTASSTSRPGKRQYRRVPRGCWPYVGAKIRSGLTSSLRRSRSDWIDIRGSMAVRWPKRSISPSASSPPTLWPASSRTRRYWRCPVGL